MARRPALRLELLECRTVPAIFGIPWADGRHLTLSFVPDGTQVDGVSSNLYSSMHGNTNSWQTEVLRAVQAWAATANINVDVVADSGNPLGADGAPQGDARFGDIRIAARPLSDNVLAMTTPSGFLGGTRVGDIVLNSSADIRADGGDSHIDLYTVMLQEIGHTFGLANSIDPNSVMFEAYSGTRTNLCAGDVASIQGLYGARAADGFEGAGGNNTLATAVEIVASAGYNGSPTLVVAADITTATDVDYFKVKTLASNPNGLTIRLNAGQSLLAPKLTVYDPNGNVVGSAQTYNPRAGEISVRLWSIKSSAYYSIKVEDANANFGVGGYQLKAVFDPNAPDATAAGAAALDDAHTNDTIGAATALATAVGYAANTHYSTPATLRDATDVDFYKIHAPRADANEQNVLTVNVRALDATKLSPVFHLFDSSKAPVSATVLANGNGTYTVQLPAASSDQDYYVSVAAGNASGMGAYQFDADFRSQVINLDSFAGGSLTAAASKDYSTLTAKRSQVMYFLLSATSDNAAVQSGVRMVVFDSQGHAVATMFARSGQTVSLTTYLAQGTYTVRFEGLSQSGTTLSNLTYALKGVTLSDPIGPTGSDPTLSGGSAADNYDWTRFSSDTYSSMLFESVSDVVW